MAPVNNTVNVSLEEGEVPVNTVQQFVEPQVLRVFRFTLFAIVMLASFIGNTVVIRAVVRARGAKTITYFLVCNLALAEIISSCCLPFLQAYEELTTWPFSDAMCHVINPLQITAGLVVTSSIAAIAVNRCLLVVRMHTHGNSRCSVVAFCVNLMLWIAAFIIAVPSFIYMTRVPSLGNDGRFWCLTLLPGDKLDSSYPSARLRSLITVHLILNYAVPITITVISYSVVIVKLKVQAQVSVAQIITSFDNTETQTETIEMVSEVCQRDLSSTKRSEPYFSEDVTPTIPPSPEQKEHARKSSDELYEYESDLLKMFYAIVLIFIICYLPYQTFFVLEYMGRLTWNNWKYFNVTRKILYLLTCCPSALHPICYGLMSRFYHKAFSRLVLCR